MTKIICCKQCSKNPDKVIESRKYIQNAGVFFCDHVVVFFEKTSKRWIRK